MNRIEVTGNARRFHALLLLTLGAAAMRLVPHPWNMTPVASLALFGGAHFRSRGAAFGVPLAAMLLSDLALGATVYGNVFHWGMLFVYPAFVLTVVLGRAIGAQSSPLRVGGAAIAAALLFYLIANFGVWILGELYPRTWEGLAACYIAALPYLRNAIVGNLVYAAILFGGFALAERRLPALRDRPVFEWIPQ